MEVLAGPPRLMLPCTKDELAELVLRACHGMRTEHLRDVRPGRIRRREIKLWEPGYHARRRKGGGGS